MILPKNEELGRQPVSYIKDWHGVAYFVLIRREIRFQRQQRGVTCGISKVIDIARDSLPKVLNFERLFQKPRLVLRWHEVNKSSVLRHVRIRSQSLFSILQETVEV